MAKFKWNLQLELVFLCTYFCLGVKSFGSNRKQTILWCDQGLAKVKDTWVPVCSEEWLQTSKASINSIAITTYHISFDGSLGICGDNKTTDSTPYDMCTWKGDPLQSVEATPELFGAKLVKQGFQTIAAVYNDMSWVRDTIWRWDI